MIAALGLAATAHAALIVREVDICVELDTAWNEHGGDTWIQDLPRNARGFAVKIKDLDADESPHASGFVPTGMPAMQSYLNSLNWLNQVEDNTSTCNETTNPTHEDNRSSSFDVTQMFWDLQIDRGLTRNQLSDLYANACPLTWAEDDTNTVGRQAWERLELSAIELGFDDELGDEESHVLH